VSRLDHVIASKLRSKTKKFESIQEFRLRPEFEESKQITIAFIFHYPYIPTKAIPCPTLHEIIGTVTPPRQAPRLLPNHNTQGFPVYAVG
jgi:hypothetical protein